MSKRSNIGDLPSYEEAEGSSRRSNSTSENVTNSIENQSQIPLEKSQRTTMVNSPERLSQLFSADNYYAYGGPDDETIGDSSEDDPDVPPAYSSGTYGHLYVNSKSPAGIGTDARVSNDGRVNIRIEQRSNQLTDVVLPALQAQLEVVQQHQQDQSFIPHSLRGEPGKLPPTMNVVIHVVGSRGDVQPFIALGKLLKTTYGHRVRLATHPTFKKSVEDNGLEFFSIGGDPSELMAFMVKNPGLMMSITSLRRSDISRKRKQVSEMIQGCWRSCIETGDGSGNKSSTYVVEDWLDDNGCQSKNSGKPFIADVIIANPPSFAHIHCAEKLGIPLHMMFTMPWSPTQIFPHPLANIQSSNADTTITNYMSYVVVDMLTWQGLGGVINRFRVNLLQLEPIHLMSAPGMLERMRIPYTYCWSPALVPKPADWDRNISISGFYFLELASNYNPDPNLIAFLEAGPPPIYIGFGSIVIDDPDTMTTIIYEAIKKIGVRALVSKGGAGLGSTNVEKPNNIFILGNVPHDWLFQRVSCVIHHGGAGTTAAGIKAGLPTVIIPFFGDQPFWGKMVSKAGAGPNPIPYKQLTSDNLATAIIKALKPSSLEKAKELAEKMNEEDGNETGAQHFHEMLNFDKLRCSLLSEKVATWRIRRTDIKLSALAAYTLAEKKILRFSELKLYRSKEYDVKRTAMNPILGGSTAILNTLGSVTKGVTDIPLNLVQGLFGFYNTGGDYYRQGSSPGMDMAMGTGKSLTRIIGSAVKSPMDITLALSKGFHYMPTLYGDDVRQVSQVTGMKSGMITAGKELGLGIFDGVTGIFSQPVIGAMKEGPLGFIKGVGKGFAGVPLKSAAGAIALPAYTMKGIHSEVLKRFTQTTENQIRAMRKAQGFEEWKQIDNKMKLRIVHSYLTLLKDMKKIRRTSKVSKSDLDSIFGDTENSNIESHKGSFRLRFKGKGKKLVKIGESRAQEVVENPKDRESLSPLSDSREIYEMPVNEELDSLSLNDSTTMKRSDDHDSELYAYPITEPTETETTNSEERNIRESRESSISHNYSQGHISKNVAKNRLHNSDELENDQMRRMLRESARLHRETIERMPSESVSEIMEDEDADSKLDEELRAAIQESKKTDEEYEREKREEQIVMEYVKKLSLAEEEFRKRMSNS